MRAELESNPIKLPMVLRSATNGHSALAANISKLIKKGTLLEKAVDGLAAAINAMRAHSTLNGNSTEFAAFIDLLRRTGVIAPIGIIPELDPKSPPPRPHISPEPWRGFFNPAPPQSPSVSPPPRQAMPTAASEHGRRQHAPGWTTEDSPTPTRKQQSSSPTYRRSFAETIEPVFEIVGAVVKWGVRFLVGAAVVAAVAFVLSNTSFHSTLQDILAAGQRSQSSATVSSDETQSSVFRTESYASDEAWNALGDSALIRNYRDFIRVFPESLHREAAFNAVRARIRELSLGSGPQMLLLYSSVGYREVPNDDEIPTGYVGSAAAYLGVYDVIRTPDSGDWYVLLFNDGRPWPFGFARSEEVVAAMTAPSVQADVITRPRMAQGAIQPDMPDRAARRRQGGRVVLAFTVTAIGTVRDLVVEEEYPTGYRFREAALRAVRSWRFEPGTMNGIAVPMEHRITVTFDPCSELHGQSQSDCHARMGGRPINDVPLP